MKSLEKDRSRRYETANGFAADIDRYLKDEPVTASPPSAAYRLRKLIRRNKQAFAVTAVVAVLLTFGSIGTAVGFVRDIRRRPKRWRLRNPRSGLGRRRRRNGDWRMSRR